VFERGVKCLDAKKEDKGWCCHLHSSCSGAMQRQMIVLMHPGNQCMKFQTSGWTC
jgi:hypothetical protein